MANGITADDVQALMDSIVEEQEALIEKLPFLQQLAINLLMAGALLAALAACGAISTLSGPGLPLAIIACAAAVLVALGTFLQMIGQWLADSAETDEIERKMARLERWKAQLEQ